MRGATVRLPTKKWRQAKREIKAVLIARVKARDIISYRELVGQVTAIQLPPQSPALSTMLREIAAEAHAAGRGMLTALVVLQPGPGFFALADGLGKNTDDLLRCCKFAAGVQLLVTGQGQGNAPSP